MLRFFFASLLMTGLLASCTPTATTSQTVNVTPVLVKLSDTAPRGGTLTIQGRFLGGASVGRVLLGNADGKTVYAFPQSAVQSWNDTEIVLTIPEDAPIGGNWLMVESGGHVSAGLRYSVR